MTRIRFYLMTAAFLLTAVSFVAAKDADDGKPRAMTGARASGASCCVCRPASTAGTFRKPAALY